MTIGIDKSSRCVRYCEHWDCYALLFSLVLLGGVKLAYGTVRTVCMAFTSVGDFQLIPSIIFH